MSLTLGLGSAISGLLTAQKGLDAVSHNIANANTPGYSRKVLEVESRVLAGYGSGVQVAELTRRVEEGLRRDLREAMSLNTSLETTYEYLQRVQDLFGKPADNNSLAHELNNLGEEFELLALESHKAAQSNQVIQVATGLADKFNTMSKQIQQLRTNADAELASYVDRVNSLLRDIDDLNKKISLNVATGRSPADLQDKRDLALNQLSELMDVSYYERETGAMVVFTASGASLIDNDAQQLSHTAVSSSQPWDSHAGNRFTAISLGQTDITNDVRSGRIKALVELRDEKLPDLQAQIDELAETLRDQINQVHNRGTSFPEMAYSLEGSNQFMDTSRVQFRITDSNADTAITIFDSDGTQKASTTLRQIMPSTTGPWTLDQLATSLQTWLNGGGGLTGATASFTDGKLSINLNNSSYSLAFRDQTTGTPGADLQDLPIEMDINLDNDTSTFTATSSHSGFSNFLGLNNLFDSGRPNWLWDSKVLPSNYRQIGSTTLSFSSATNGISFGQVVVNNNDTLEDIAERINATSSLENKVVAAVVPEGSGQRLRIQNLDGSEMVITRSAGTADAFAGLGLSRSNCGDSTFLKVSDTLSLNPDRLSRGRVQYNSDNGEFYVATGDNSVANELANAFTDTHDFDLAGGLSTGSLSFGDYAASVLSNAASNASEAERSLSYQRNLKESLELKDAETSQVSLDEELSQLMIYQQAYSAAAKVISTTKQMFDVLNSLVR